MLPATNFQSIFNFLQNHGYFILLLLMIIEGPIITYVAAFASALDIFSIYWIFILSILGNSIPDKLIYFLGRLGRTKSIEHFVEYFGLNSKKIKILEKHLKEHLTKTLIFSKIVPPFPIPAMLLSGFIKADFKKFFIVTTIFDIVSSIIFAVTGYLSGFMANSTLKYFKIEAYGLPIFTIIAFLAYYLIKWAYKKIAKYFK
jgi:membrane-associated protein